MGALWSRLTSGARICGSTSLEEKLLDELRFSQRDLQFVRRCIAEDKDRRQNVDWDQVMATSYWYNHKDIVRYIRDSGRGSVNAHLYYSCLLGDLEFFVKCLAEDKNREQNWNWDEMMEISYDNKHMDIVRYFRDSGLGSANLHLHYSCMLGDLEFFVKYFDEDKDREQDVDWENLLTIANAKKHMGIVRCIRDSGRVSLQSQLHSSCLLRDLEFVSQCIAEDRDRNQNVNWALIMGAANDHYVPIAKIIVETGRYTLADPTDTGWSHIEITADGEKIMKFVIRNTGDVNREIRPGLNTLHVACYLFVSQRNPFSYRDGDPALDENILYQILEKGAKVNQKGYMGRTALHFLCHGFNEDIYDIIEGKKVDRNTAPNQGKKSMLCAGGRINGPNIVRAIAEFTSKGSDVNAKDDNGQTPLHLLCLSEGEVEIGTILLERGANVNQRDSDGRTPVAVAAQYGNAKFISFLCEKGCDKNMGNFMGMTPLYLSTIADKLLSVQILCEEGVDVNQADEYNVTPLAAACEFDYRKIVDLLLKYGADPSIADMEERTALHKTALYGSSETCKRLVELQVNIDINVQDITGCTALHFGANENQIRIINILTNAGIGVNIENNLGNTALHNAASNRNEDVAQILLQNGLDIDHKNNYGDSPIMASASGLNLAMIKFLNVNNATLDLVNNMHRNAIHNVVENYPHVCLSQTQKLQKCQDIIEWLIEKGISINAVDMNKQTPLHLAAHDGDLGLVSFLVDNGSDVFARDSFNHMPLMNAVEHPEVFQYLWGYTLCYITEEDFCELQRLSYWFNISDAISTIQSHAPIVIELSNMPQNVRKLKHRFTDHLEYWLQRDEDKLPESMLTWLSNLQTLTYIDHPRINSVMWEFLNDLQNGVKKEDPLVAYIVTRCGSIEEKTKAFAQDEYDCSCVLDNIRFQMFETPKEPDHPIWTAFVHLVCEEKYYDHLTRVLDGKKQLSQGKLCHHFGKAIGKVLACPAFWTKYPQLQRISAKDISAGDRRICTMHVIWSDEICPWLKIDIDLAPVIDLSKWKPSWCSQHVLTDEIECIALPKWKMTPQVNIDLMEIGVHSWGPLFHKMPEEMRQGYRLAKVVRGSAVCPQIRQSPGEVYAPEAKFLDLADKNLFPEEEEEDYVEWSNAGEFINTYLLKQVIMHEYAAWYDRKMEGLEPLVHTDVYWARRIYEKMEEAFRQQELYSWFIPTYNLLTDDKFVQYKDTAVMYARLCRRLLTEEAADHFRKAYLGVQKDIGELSATSKSTMVTSQEEITAL